MKRFLLYLSLFIFCLFSSAVHAQWQKINLPPASGTGFKCMASEGTNIFAGSYGNTGIYLSTNNGELWAAINNGLIISSSISAIAISGSNIYAASSSAGVFLSTNNGELWTDVNTNLTNKSLSTIASNGTSVFVSTGLGMFLSTNNGGSWAAANSGLGSSSITSIVFSGTNIFAGLSGDGVYLSTNNGSSWQTVNTGLANKLVMGLAVNGSKIFAATFGGVFLSTDNGTTWTSSSTGITTNLLYNFAFSGTNVFAGTANEGVFLSSDGGSTWSSISTGLGNLVINSLVVNGTNIFAGTNDGIWRRPLSEIISSVEEIPGEIPKHYALHQNYPNPFNPATNIRIEIPFAGFVSLKMFDILGREVAELLNENKSAGSYEVNFNGEEFPSGVYFYKVKTANFTSTKKMILIK